MIKWRLLEGEELYKWYDSRNYVWRIRLMEEVGIYDSVEDYE